MTGKVCIYTPPDGVELTPYLVRLISIIQQLDTLQNKELAKERLQMLIDDITRVIKALKKPE